MKNAFRLRGSVAARLVAGHGLLMAASIAVVAAVFYIETVGVLDRSVNDKITSISRRLALVYEQGGEAALARAVQAQLNDGVDSDTEVVALLSAAGQPRGGNLRAWPGPLPEPDQTFRRELVRGGRPIMARLVARRLSGGELLVVGRDVGLLRAVRGVVARALLAGCAVSLLAIFGGALLFRRLVEARVGKIRTTANAIAAGDITRRIVVQGHDEFALLGRDINRMLDRIEQLMDGVRHVSNSIAHDLRTPLTRVRGRLDDALQRAGAPGVLAQGARLAIEDIDSLTGLFDKLLQIAAAESGMRPATAGEVDLRGIAVDMVELYEAAADEAGVTLVLDSGAQVAARGDRDLLASALASLIDNAIKYAAPGVVRVAASAGRDCVSLSVSDSGPGVPAAELDKLAQRFYRVDRSRHLPGNGLGLSIVAAIAKLHSGSLELSNASPGFEARIVLPLPA